jgi:hypothetical protein
MFFVLCETVTPDLELKSYTLHGMLQMGPYSSPDRERSKD